jgi:phosphotransferase system HPr (HPr) family protein
MIAGGESPEGGDVVVSFTHTIEDGIGLHARPAAQFVRVAAGFDAEVRVRCGEREADAKSLLEVLQLEARTGTSITVSAAGPDAEDALAALQEALRSA